MLRWAHNARLVCSVHCCEDAPAQLEDFRESERTIMQMGSEVASIEPLHHHEEVTFRAVDTGRDPQNFADEVPRWQLLRVKFP